MKRLVASNKLETISTQSVCYLIIFGAVNSVFYD